MSRRELRRVEVLARVQAEELKLIDAASLMGVSYRQAKRRGKRYREEGAEGMKHRSAGRRSSRAKPEKFRHQVLGLVRRKYSGEEGRRFGPTLAAGGRVVEPGAEAPAASAAARAQAALWRTGADGRQLSRLARRTRSAGLPDGHGGRRHRRHAGAAGKGGDDLGGSAHAARLDRALWRAAGDLCGLEESVQARAHVAGTAAGRRAGHAVRTHVREAGHPDHRG